MIKVYNYLVDDDPKSVRMFYPHFRLNNFTMHVTGFKNSAEYSVSFLLPSRDLYVHRSGSFAIFDIYDFDESSTIFDAFQDYDLDTVYERAKKIAEKVANKWEADIENAE